MTRGVRLSARPHGAPARRRVATLAVALCAAVVGLVVIAPAAAAHPLGNFTVNSASALRIEPTAVVIDVVVDAAEIPTLQNFPGVDAAQPGGGIDEATRAGYRERECAEILAGLRLTVAGRPAELGVQASTLDFLPGSAGLATSRLTCTVRTVEPVDTVDAQLTYRDETALTRTGWREITAVGDGVEITESTVPAESVSNQLRAYPDDLLSSPLDQREAVLTVGAGSGVATGGGAEDVQGPATVGAVGVDFVTTAFTGLIASTDLTVGFGALAMVLAVGLGALHAFAPGHGKALMAAYLIGQNGTLRQASLIGLSVTLTHTLGVLILGVAITVLAVAAPERVYPWLGLISGLLLIGIGVVLLRRGLARRRADRHDHGQGHGHGHGHRHREGHEHGHEHAGHEHAGHEDGSPASAAPGGPSQAVEPALVPAGGVAVLTPDTSAVVHSHGPGTRAHSHPVATNARSLLAVGFAGGMVPSPSALVVLLGGIALGRAWFSVLLVIAYGVGMALALVGTGLALVYARDRIERWASARERAGRRTPLVLSLGRALPALTAGVVIVVGFGLAVQAVIAM